MIQASQTRAVGRSCCGNCIASICPAGRGDRLCAHQAAAADRGRRAAPAHREGAELMQRNGIGAVLIESGPSLDYFTGIQWWRSERLTGVVIPARAIRSSSRPSSRSPRSRKCCWSRPKSAPGRRTRSRSSWLPTSSRSGASPAQPIGFEETNRFFIQDRLQQQLPAARIVSANPVVRALADDQVARRDRADAGRGRHHGRLLRYAGERTREGMTPAEIDALIAAAQKTLGGTYDGGLILLGEAAAYPHGSRASRSTSARARSCCSTAAATCMAISPTSRGPSSSAPTRRAEQRKVWDQVHRGQQIAMAAAKIGAPAGSVDDAVRRTYESWGYGPATSCRARRTAPATASAWRSMSRSTSSTAK